MTYPENLDEVRRVMKRYRDQTDMQQNNRGGRRQSPAEVTHQEKRIKIVEKQNLWELSPAEIYCMITILKLLRNGEFFTTVLEWGKQFIPINGLGASISLPYSCDCMGFLL
ncbi:hypothetical protein NE237_001627 [Protea cynaroides]|uniref:Uncharacterized protein n=1 Tax=Protea cynaroides TaxID=273540 RepID=A0A9Q0KUI1_9MAGN|nr:hypothetical protein NE237_001627 [Protea cynaroides]